MISAVFCVTSRSAPAPIRCGIERPGSSGDTSAAWRRRRWLVLMLGGLTAFYTARLATERDRAQREAVKAARVSEALTGLLMGADPIANRATAGRTDGSAGCSMRAAERVQKELVGPARGAGRDFYGHRKDVSPPRHLRQGTAAARTSAHQRPSGVRAGARECGADPQRSRRTGGREGRLQNGGRKPRVGAEHPAQNLRSGAHECRRHACRARPHLPGSGVQRARRAASPRSAGDQAESARRRTRRNRRQPERPCVGSAPERRPRRAPRRFSGNRSR